MLRPLQATASRCALAWQEPFLLFESRHAEAATLEASARRYAERLAGLPG
ncbi:hypothetical protein ACFOD4_16010 [Pseudoroseomonas globiformis]|uniref:Uncharacterized protein n=1 Tax=Teichococcus globiformis TaxID=2307229 RepID=A0ABV7G1J8_9PROT